MLFQRNKACCRQHDVSINSKHQQLDFKSFIVILHCFIGIDYQVQNQKVPILKGYSTCVLREALILKKTVKKGTLSPFGDPPPKRVKRGHLSTDYRKKCVNGTRDILMLIKARKMTILAIIMF